MRSFKSRLPPPGSRNDRRSVSEGLSPNILRYSTEKRPSSTKPRPVATLVTVPRTDCGPTSARGGVLSTSRHPWEPGGYFASVFKSFRCPLVHRRHLASDITIRHAVIERPWIRFSEVLSTQPDPSSRKVGGRRGRGRSLSQLAGRTRNDP